MNVSDYAPLVGSVGGGFVRGALAGFAIKQVMKIAAVVIGLFIAALAYMQYQGFIHVDWIRVQSVSQNGIPWVVDAITHISNNIGAPHTLASNFGISDIIPLTSSASAGFVWGLTLR
jgi:uncharacterized membrane protein (Fun14 family)